MQCYSLSQFFTEDQPIDSISISDATRSLYDFFGGQIIVESNNIGFGIAPSLLWSKDETVSHAEPYTPPAPNEEGILLTNLSKDNAIELFLGKSSDEIITLLWQKSIKPKLRWINSKGELTLNNLTINQSDWIREVNNA